MLHGIYWGVGSGSGAIFSGIHVAQSGFKHTFLLFTWMTIAVGFMYLAVELLTFVIDIRISGVPNKTSISSTGSEADVSSEGASSEDEYE